VTEVGLIAARFVHYAALVLAFGAFAYAGYGAKSVSVGRRLGRLGLASSLLLLVATVAVLAATIAGLGGGFASIWDAMLWSAVVQDTGFGRVWSVRLVMALLLVALSVAVWRWPGQAPTRAAILLAGGLVATVALTGHAAVGEGAPGLVHRAADAAHMLAAAVWLGALPPLLFLLGRNAPGVSEQPDLALARLQAFHSVGVASVSVLLVSGLVNSWLLVGNPDGLLTTSYGRLLVAKVALFAVIVGLAAQNRLRLVPALAHDLAGGGHGCESVALLRSCIRAELVLGMLVLLTVAVLGSMAPASE
jgi:putative copper resistance protein D